MSRARDAFDRGQILQRSARRAGELLPVREVDLERLRGLADREHLEAALAVNVALLEETVYELRLLLVGQVARQVGHTAHAIDHEGRVSVREEGVRHGCGADAFLGRVRHGLRQLIHAALARMGDHDAQVLATRVVEFLDQVFERLLLGTVVVRPQLDLNRVGRVEHRSLGLVFGGRGPLRAARQGERGRHHAGNDGSGDRADPHGSP